MLSRFLKARGAFDDGAARVMPDAARRGCSLPYTRVYYPYTMLCHSDSFLIHGLRYISTKPSAWLFR